MKALFGSIVLVLFLTACNNNKPSEEKQADMIDTSSGNTAKANENPYEGLRELAFSMKPEQLNIQTSGDSTQVYGVIMDSGMPDFTTTIVAYLSGDASMYTSTGGGVIGGVQHENVRQAAKEFVTAANKSLHGATKTDSTPLPAKGHFNIYLLTNKGIYSGTGEWKTLDQNSVWAELAQKSDKLMAEMSKTGSK